MVGDLFLLTRPGYPPPPPAHLSLPPRVMAASPVHFSLSLEIFSSLK